MNTSNDSLQVLLFDAAPVRGEIVRIESSWQAILQHKDYPLVVRRLLGELVAAGILLSGTLKFKGSLIIQAQGQGPIKLLVVECDDQLNIRATAKLDDSVDFSALEKEKASLSKLIHPNGQGQLVITLDPADRKPGQNPYQGIVSLSDSERPISSIAEAIELYMRNSEQLETRVWLANDDKSCGGLLLQRLPNLGGQLNMEEAEAADSWSRIQILTETITTEELLTLPTDTIMKRLYLDESQHHGVRSFEARSIQFKCRCSRIKVANMLKMLGEEEVNSLLAEQNEVATTCEFCGQVYKFDAVDCKQVFASSNLSAGVQSATQTKH